MDEDLSKLPLADADRIARERIETARAEMSTWRQARAQRLVEARASGMSVEEIATEIGVKAVTVYEVMRAAKG